MINEALLKILACPETHQKVSMASAELIAALNRKVADKSLRNRASQVITEPCDGGLVREDGKLLYPIRQGIPVMLVDEAIEL